MNPNAWSSLADQQDVAEELFGSHHGHALLSNWLEEQRARVGDFKFGSTFTDHLDLPGIHALDCTHRMVSYRTGSVLGGIRFYRRDVQRPFVEVVAHSFDELDQLCECVRTEWAMFRPRYLRLRTRPKRLTGPRIQLDVTIHAARYEAMACTARSVTVAPFDRADDAIAMIKERFEHMRVTQPALFKNVSQANPDDLRKWHAGGQLRAIMVSGRPVGALAVVPGALEWIKGDEINEEVIVAAESGHGYAAAAQAAWARTASNNPAVHLIGTIDHLNLGSRTTAERAGRPRILDETFVSVEASTTDSGAARASTSDRRR